MKNCRINFDSTFHFEREIAYSRDEKHRSRMTREWKSALRRANVRDFKFVSNGPSVRVRAKLAVRQAFMIGEHEARIAERLGNTPAVRERVDDLFRRFIAGFCVSGQRARRAAAA